MSDNDNKTTAAVPAAPCTIGVDEGENHDSPSYNNPASCRAEQDRLRKPFPAGMAETTDFGYRQVKWQEKSAQVAQVFHSVASKYDVMNDLMSFGIHRLWKRFTLDHSEVRKGDLVLDLAGGTGDLAKLFAPIVGPTGGVTLVDINLSMLQIGRDRLLDAGITTVNIIQADAEHLPFSDESFDCVVIAFGLRNVTDKNAALREMCRVTKPGGRALILEFSKPQSTLLNQCYDFYSFKLLPKIGKWVVGDEASYQYLAESIRMHPDQEALKTMMQEAGFIPVTYHNLTGGIVALHIGLKE